MNESIGNLALKKRRPAAPRQKAQVLPLRPTVIKTKRIPASEVQQERRTEQIRSRQIRRCLARQRLKMLASVISVVFIIAGLFSFIVYRQAMIVEQNFENLALERRITLLEQENSQLSEMLAQKTNLDYIRHQAIEQMGLQDPARSQIVTVYVPDTDRVVFHGSSTRQTEEEAYLNHVYNTLEGFFLNLHQQRKVD